MRSRILIVVGALAAALICGGWFLETGFHRASRWAFGSSDEGERVFAEVLEHVQREYVDSLPMAQIYDKSIDGMLYELHDPHSVFLPADRLRRLTESTTGTYVGIGIQVDIRDGWITVIAPFDGSPAQRGGVQGGDRLVEIDGRSTHGWTQEEASAALRGAPGTPLHVLINARASRSESRWYSLGARFTCAQSGTPRSSGRASGTWKWLCSATRPTVTSGDQSTRSASRACAPSSWTCGTIRVAC